MALYFMQSMFAYLEHYSRSQISDPNSTSNIKLRNNPKSQIQFFIYNIWVKQIMFQLAKHILSFQDCKCRVGSGSVSCCWIRIRFLLSDTDLTTTKKPASTVYTRHMVLCDNYIVNKQLKYVRVKLLANWSENDLEMMQPIMVEAPVQQYRVRSLQSSR